MGEFPVRVKIAKKEGGPFSFMALHATVDDAPKDFYVKVINGTNHDQEATLEDLSAGSGEPNFKIRWLRGEQGITSEVQGGGYGFGLKPGKPKVFRAVVKPLAPDPGALCLAPRATVQPDDVQVVGAVYINDTGVCG
jgi:hypothetical protein